MNNKITFNQVAQRLTENNVSFESIDFNNGLKIIVSQMGGRIFGPFEGDNGESILWINKAFESKEAFTALLKSGYWNHGGDRVWIAPELQYNVKDRNNFFASYDLPEQIDPGNYVLVKPGMDEIKLSQEMKLKIYDKEAPEKELKLERIVKSIENPLKGFGLWEESKDKILYAGFEHEITLKESDSNEVLSEAWNLTQLNPGGQLYICSYPGVEYTDYYEPVDNEYQMIFDNHIKVEVTGNRRFKVGYKAISICGRIGYYNRYENGKAYLFVRNFFSDPLAPYTKEPADSPGKNGHSLHVYNDNEEHGGFAELECSGCPIGGITGKNKSTDKMVTWLYMGDDEAIKKIAFYMLGVKI